MRSRARVAVLISLVLGVSLAGCYVIPAQRNDFSKLPDDPLTAPIKDYVRSWNKPPIDYIEMATQAAFKGHGLKEFTGLVSRHAGSCKEALDPSAISCSASFSWSAFQRERLWMTETRRNRICLTYDVRLSEQVISDISVRVTCFE